MYKVLGLGIQRYVANTQVNNSSRSPTRGTHLLSRDITPGVICTFLHKPNNFGTKMIELSLGEFHVYLEGLLSDSTRRC